jgi:hypothetical protein
MSIFTPDTEPYLHLETVRNLDLHIVRAMEYYNAFGIKSLAPGLSSMQVAACEIIPQGMSIALSIRELVRQAYLYSSMVLVRPLIERTGTITLLLSNPDMLSLWHSGWPRKKQPSFDTLLRYAIQGSTREEHLAMQNVMHKLVHSDPHGSKFNLQSDSPADLMTFASGKELNAPLKADAVCRTATHCIRQLTTLSVGAFIYGDTTET